MTSANAAGILFPDATTQSTAAILSTPKATNPVSPITLKVGEYANYNFTAITTLALNITCSPNETYELLWNQTNGLATWNLAGLRPNNLAYGAVFINAVLYAVSNVVTYAVGGVGSPLSQFPFPWVSTQGLDAVTLSTVTNNKCVTGMSCHTSTTFLEEILHLTTWNDTTTVWTSLGTIIAGGADTMTGVLTVRRIG